MIYGYHEDRIRRIRKMMNKNNFDAIVLTNLTSLSYTAGTFHSLWNSGVAIVVPLQGEVTMIVPLGDSFRVKPETWIKDVRSWTPPFRNIKEIPYESLLVDVLKEKDLTKKVIGLEEEVLLWNTYNKLKDILPNAEFRDVGAHMLKLMAIKDEEEIKLSRQAAAIADKGIYAALEFMKPGNTEYDLAAAADYAMRKGGAEMFYAPTTVSADYRLGPDHNPTERILQRGDIIKIDLHPVYKNYRSDRLITAIIGKPTPEFRKLADAVEAGTQSMLEKSVPGSNGTAIYEAFTDTIEKYGFMDLDTTWYLGHGIGTGHLPPLIYPGDKTELEPNMIVCLNPLIFKPGIHSMMEEFIIRITETKPEFMHKTPVELIVIE